jgi:uncharacterized membrane protein
MTQAYTFALLSAIFLSLHGYRKGSLSGSGAFAAFLIGYLTLANPVLAFGFTLLSFYLLGSKATKIGHERKARLERNYIASKENGESENHKAKSGGQRDWVQVCCNGLGGAVPSFAFRTMYTSQWQNGKAWCLLRSARPNSIAASFLHFGFYQHVSSSPLPRLLSLFALGHFACCMGDTLASEMGILSKSPPRLILAPSRKVPAGTNGGLSILGTLGSLMGGAFIGLVAGFTLLYIDNPACHHYSGKNPLLKIIVLGAMAGLGGSMIDSFLGATLQRTWYHKQSKQVLLGRLPSRANPQEWQVITGRDVLSNNSVNLLSSLLTATCTALLGNQLFH